MSAAQAGELLRPLLQSIRHGVAAADPDTLQILFENACFFAWFKPRGEAVETLADRLAGCPIAQARARLAEGRPFVFQTESQGRHALAQRCRRPAARRDRREPDPARRGAGRQQAEGGRVHAQLLLEAGRAAQPRPAPREGASGKAAAEHHAAVGLRGAQGKRRRCAAALHGGIGADARLRRASPQ